MKYALYSGCTVLGRGRNYEMATRAVANILGIELVDLDGFECCGFPIKSVHYETFLLMAACNLLTAEDKGLDICTLCSACTSSLTEANKHLTEHFNEKVRIIATLKKQGINYRMRRNIRVKHFARILYEDIGIDKIKKLVKKKLSNLNIASHYGCHYLKPTDIYNNPEDPENPYSLDDLIRVTGANSINYSEKLKCCGAGILAISEDLAYSIARPKLQELACRGLINQTPTDAMVLVCPFCSVMYDDNQRKIESKFGEKYELPVLYYPQLLGLSLGIDEKLLGLRMNRVSTRALLEKIKSL
ncbi:MAG: CoB--CoM heterodisulfide reductase iron-sulfur subunit B family protein [bacterium]|nr:CoB--CoM heterodisulfide reductase iron-sulfur subunit B family protein [bacterium]